MKNRSYKKKSSQQSYKSFLTEFSGIGTPGCKEKSIFLISLDIQHYFVEARDGRNFYRTLNFSTFIIFRLSSKNHVRNIFRAKVVSLGNTVSRSWDHLLADLHCWKCQSTIEVSSKHAGWCPSIWIAFDRFLMVFLFSKGSISKDNPYVLMYNVSRFIISKNVPSFKKMFLFKIFLPQIMFLFQMFPAGNISAPRKKKKQCARKEKKGNFHFSVLNRMSTLTRYLFNGIPPK